MKIAIVGSRTFNNYRLFKEYVDYIIKCFECSDDKIEFVSGGAKGPDSFAERYAKENNIKIKVFKPEWDKYGKKAGFLRNEKIVNGCDTMLAFWDYESSGTKNSIEVALKNENITGLIYKFENTNDGISRIEECVSLRDLREQINNYQQECQ